MAVRDVIGSNGMCRRSRGLAWGVAALGALALLLLLPAVPIPGGTAGAGYVYPPTRRSDVIDDYHGTMVADPYRWLEDADSEETAAWVEAQNALFNEYIDTPDHDIIKKRLTAIWNYPKFSLPYKRGGRYFYWKNDGLQNHSVMYVQETPESGGVPVLDPNTLSEDGTVGVVGTSLTEDATLMTYSTTTGGTEWQEVKIREVDSGLEFDETLVHCLRANPAWKHDNSGFYYSRHRDPATVPPEDQFNYSHVCWHTLGTPQSEDVIIHERPDDKTLGFAPFITRDGEYLFLYVYRGSEDKNGLYYRRVESDGEFVHLLDDMDASYGVIENIGTRFYIQTDLDAPKGRLIVIDLDNPARADWHEIIPERDDVLAYTVMVNNQLVVAYMHDAHYRLELHGLDGTFLREIELPTLGSLAGVSGRREDTEMFVGFTSFLYPTSQFRYDFATEAMSLFRSPDIDFDPSLYETKQVFYESKDGTRIPMFITHKKGLVLDGSNPTELYGYGGFGVSMTPFFTPINTIWLENGGVFALACIRGGGEYGQEWHDAGKLEKRQNVYDDFITGGEWLIKNGYTSPSRFVMAGGSNGGLLVATCMTQRPDLCSVVLCQAPVTDLLRNHKLGLGRYWVADYGNAEENPEHFRFMYAHSPLHNVEEGTTYPATLITAADHDNRVMPSHAKKFAATLQAADTGENPILLRIETKAGHWVGIPTEKMISEIADSYAFVFRVLGMTPKASAAELE